MEIPHQQLSPEALQGLLEEFVSRDGTDYGEQEVSLEQKTRQVFRQLEKGECIIVFDADTDSVNIVNKSEVTHATDRL